MIFILHGEDFTASYAYLQSLLKKYSNFQKVYFAAQNTLRDFQAALGAQNLFGQEEILICQNFISDKKIDSHGLKAVVLSSFASRTQAYPLLKSWGFRSLEIKSQGFKKIPTAKNIVFWEEAKISLGKIKESNQISTVEFKLPTTLFSFLDSISPKSLAPLTYLRRMKDKGAINWHVANRLMLLVLAKQNLTQDQVQTLIKKPLAAWQWQKITNQAKNFDPSTLYQMFNAVLTVDMIKKQGKTEADYESLITLLLIKYLKHGQMIQ